MLASIRGKPLIVGLASLLVLLSLYYALQDKTDYVPKLSSALPKGFTKPLPAEPAPKQPPPSPDSSSHATSPPSPPSSEKWSFDPVRDERNLGLSEEQCSIAFPDQYAEIERAVAWHTSQGGIQESQIKLWREEPDKAHGQIRILIHNGDLYIVGEKQGVVDRTRYLMGASMIYRAITSIPDPSVLPNVEFTLDRMDHPNPEPQRPGRTAWAWTRHVSDNNTWVMPDFNGWASSNWDTVGGYRAYRTKSAKFLTPFADKIRKALWRGQINVGMKISTVRKTLLEVSKDKPWSDTGDFTWGGHREAIVPMEEHCKWQFLIHTEGNSWSGRLRNLVNCNSVIIIHNPLEYVAHFYPLLTPSGEKQNYVAAKNDWSDLDEIMRYYLEHQDKAEQIAEESRRTFRDRYMTPAAEACYIRRMIYSWAKVQKFKPELFKEEKDKEGKVHEKMRGVAWERFAFRGPPRFDIPKPPDDYFFKSDKVDFED